MACTSCGRGFHSECDIGCKECHEEGERLANSIREIGVKRRPLLPDHLVTDVISTGRKRAASMYKIDNTLPCEWRGLKNCGGGIPIYGCINGFMQDIHHGPDKNTLNNERENIHLICKKCHKRWHFTNDSVYVREEYVLTKHEPEEATREELYQYELKWITTPRGHFNVDEDAE